MGIYTQNPFMASKIAEKAPGWFTRILMPEIIEIKGELKNINTRIHELDKRLTDKIDSTRNELKSDISRVDSRIDEMDKRLTSRIDSGNEKLSAKIDDLDKRLDIVSSTSYDP